MNKEKHKSGTDGIVEDGVSSYPADAHDMDLYKAGHQALDSMSVPILHDSRNPHSRMFVAAFDGTWNDADKDPAHKTNIGLIRDQIKAGNAGANTGVHVSYVNGVGTQDNFVTRTLDGAMGYTYDARLEQMYASFIKQAAKWKREDPDVQITTANIGFSRGAEQAAGFARLVHERGIQDPDGLTRRVENGRAVIEYTKPPLVRPGQTAQAVGLFDPVGTGDPRNHDRRLPSSVISGFQLTAEDERRSLFKSTSIIDQGMSTDGRFLAVMMPGAHSNVGGGYHRDGLSLRSGNLMIDYLNSLSDTPFLQKQAVPDDPRMNLVHRSEEGMLIYKITDKVDRRTSEGVVEVLAPDAVCRVVTDCRNAEPVDVELASRFHFRRNGEPDPATTMPAVPASLTPWDPLHPDHALFQQSRSAVWQLDAQLGRSPDEASDRLAASLLPAAKLAGMERIDHVLLSDHSGQSQAGRVAFAVEGPLDSPLKKVAHVDTQQAISTPVADSFGKLEAINQQRVIDQEVPMLLMPVWEVEAPQRKAMMH